jgi:CheY-like chemotaxis protein
LRRFAADLDAFATLQWLPEDWRTQFATLARQMRAAAEAPDELEQADRPPPKAPTRRHQERHEALAPVGAGRRVLIISDDAGLTQSAGRLLTDEGYEVRQVADGHDALALLARWSADLVLLDLYLTGLDGSGILAEIERARAIVRPRIVVWSGADHDELERAGALGADVCLPRGSTTPQQLLDAVDRLLLRRP